MVWTNHGHRGEEVASLVLRPLSQKNEMPGEGPYLPGNHCRKHSDCLLGNTAHLSKKKKKKDYTILKWFFCCF